MRLFHISDLHFQADIPWSRFPSLGWRRLVAQTEYRLLGRRDRFAAVVATVRRLLAEAVSLKADHLLVSGDLTALALPEEFEEARQHLASWSGRMTIIPGNHDRYTPGAARARLFETTFERELTSDLPGAGSVGPYPVVKLVTREVALVGLCSARVPVSPGFAAGWIGRTQRRALAELLAHPELRRRSVFVTCHHAPFRPDGRPDRLNHGLVDARALLRVLSEGGAIALGHGHIHRRYRIDHPGAPPIFCAGSSTEVHRAGYFLYQIENRSLEATRVTYDDAAATSG
jgi:3',5'-cyclic AMP phosphodiesterase CpdA